MLASNDSCKNCVFGCNRQNVENYTKSGNSAGKRFLWGSFLILFLPVLLFIAALAVLSSYGLAIAVSIGFSLVVVYLLLLRSKINSFLRGM